VLPDDLGSYEAAFVVKFMGITQMLVFKCTTKSC